MKNLFILCALIGSLFCSIEDLNAGCCPPKRTPPSCCGKSKRPVSFKKNYFKPPYKKKDRKDVLMEKMGREEPGTKKYIRYQQEREIIALEEIHQAQKDLLEIREQLKINPRKKKRMARKERDAHNLIQSETAFLAKTLGEIDNFPFRENLTNIFPILDDIGSGKLEYKKSQQRQPIHTLEMIQESQLECLKKYHKKQNEKND